MGIDLERATYSVEEAAKILGVGRQVAYSGVRNGSIPAIRVQGRWLVPKRALERFLEAKQGESAKVP